MRMTGLPESATSPGRLEAHAVGGRGSLEDLKEEGGYHVGHTRSATLVVSLASSAKIASAFEHRTLTARREAASGVRERDGSRGKEAGVRGWQEERGRLAVCLSSWRRRRQSRKEGGVRGRKGVEERGTPSAVASRRLEGRATPLLTLTPWTPFTCRRPLVTRQSRSRGRSHRWTRRQT